MAVTSLYICFYLKRKIVSSSDITNATVKISLAPRPALSEVEGFTLGLCLVPPLPGAGLAVAGTATIEYRTSR